MKLKTKIGIILCLILILIPNTAAAANSPTMYNHYVVTVHYVDTEDNVLSKPYSFIAPYEYKFSPKIRNISGYFYTGNAKSYYIVYMDMDIYLIYIRYTSYEIIYDAAVPLGIEIPVNQVGDCFD